MKLPKALSKRRDKSENLDGQANAVVKDDPYPPVIFSARFREQVINVMDRHLGDEMDPIWGRKKIEPNVFFWNQVYKGMAADLGSPSRQMEVYKQAVFSIIRRCHEKVVVACLVTTIQWLNETTPYERQSVYFISEDPEEYVPRLNRCLEENSVDWRFVGTRFTPATTNDAEDEFLLPAFILLEAEGFEGAIEEFSHAMVEFRAGDNKRAVADAAKAFESTLSTICDRMGWDAGTKPRASDLFNIVAKNGLFPLAQETAYKTFFDTMKQGLPEVRNKMAAHGQGSKSTEVPRMVARYAMNLAGTNITFAIECYQALKAKSEKG